MEVENLPDILILPLGSVRSHYESGLVATALWGKYLIPRSRDERRRAARGSVKIPCSR